MKKILCSILALVCVFSLFSCGDKTEELIVPFKTAISNSAPTSMTSQTSYGEYKQTYAYVGGTHATDGKAAATYTSTVERLANVEDTADGTKVTEVTVKYYHDGKVKTDDGAWAEGNALYSGITLNLTADAFEKKSAAVDGNTLTGVILADKIESVFGAKIEGAGNVNIKIVTDGVYLKTVELTYKVNDVEIKVVTSYSYGNNVLDFKL